MRGAGADFRAALGLRERNRNDEIGVGFRWRRSVLFTDTAWSSAMAAGICDNVCLLLGFWALEEGWVAKISSVTERDERETAAVQCELLQVVLWQKIILVKGQFSLR